VLGDIDDPIERFMRLRPLHLAWKIDGEEFDGFLAHEVAEVVPGAVTGEKDAVDDDGGVVAQQLDVSRLVPLLTAAVQALTRQVAELTDRIATLEGAAA
jgi:hypothetical protein